MDQLRLKENVEPVFSTDFWYDLVDGGYIKPEDFLQSEDAKKVVEAITLLHEFRTTLEINELLELG